jgi:hypothetical protein
MRQVFYMTKYKNKIKMQTLKRKKYRCNGIVSLKCPLHHKKKKDIFYPAVQEFYWLSDI